MAVVIEVMAIVGPLLTAGTVGTVAYLTIDHGRREADRRDLRQAVDRLLQALQRVEHGLGEHVYRVETSPRKFRPVDEPDELRSRLRAIAVELDTALASLQVRLPADDELRQATVDLRARFEDAAGLTPQWRRPQHPEGSYRTLVAEDWDDARDRALAAAGTPFVRAPGGVAGLGDRWGQRRRKRRQRGELMAVIEEGRRANRMHRNATSEDVDLRDPRHRRGA